MPSISEQKRNLHDIMASVVLESFDNGNEEVQRNIVRGLLSLLARKMTLKETRDWHRGWTLTMDLRDRWREDSPDD